MKKGYYTDLQGLQLRFLSMAVRCTEADQVRLGCSKRSNVSASSLILPFPAAANWTRRCCGVAAREKGRKQMEAKSIIFMSVTV